MDFLQLSDDGSDIKIEGYPDGVKVVRLDGPLARRAADLALHQQDLEFAQGCIQVLEGQPNTSSIAQRAIWHAAIVHYMKCFGGSNSRAQLNEKAVYKAKPGAFDPFNFIKNLRHKHVVHDENSHHDARTGAIINDGTKAFKIEKIVVHTQVAMTLENENLGNLRLLIEDALAWVCAQFDEVAAKLTEQLEKESHADLLAREQLRWDWPKLDEVSRARTR
jgi:hypothetical protein